MILRNLFNFSAPLRRRAPCTVAAEVSDPLESRMLLASCMPPGAYFDQNSDDPGNENNLNVYEGGKGKKSFGDLSLEGFGRFSVTIKCNKDGVITITPKSKGVSGKITAIPVGPRSYDAQVNIVAGNIGYLGRVEWFRL